MAATAGSPIQIEEEVAVPKDRTDTARPADCAGLAGSVHILKLASLSRLFALL